MNENSVVGVDTNGTPEKSKMSNSYKLFTIILVIVLLVIGSASLLVMGYFGNTRAAALYDGAKEFIYQASYERAKDKSKDAVELANSNWLISSKLKDNINILDKKIDGYLLINKSRAVLGDGNVSEAYKLLKQGLLCSSDLEEEEKEYIQLVNTSRVDKANKDRIEALLSNLMKEKNVALNYKNLDDVSRLVSEEAGLCGIASIRNVTYDNYYYIDLTTYDNKKLIVYIGSDYRNDKMYKALHENGKLEVALIVKKELSIYATWNTYYEKRLKSEDVLAQETGNKSNNLVLDEELTKLNRGEKNDQSSSNLSATLEIKETNKAPIGTAIGNAPNNELWINYANGQKGLLVQCKESDDLKNQVAGIANAQMSVDGTKVYFECMAWVTSSNIFVVDIKTKKVKQVCDGDGLDVPTEGKYKGYIIITKHEYRPAPDFGATNYRYAVDDNGNKLGKIE